MGISAEDLARMQERLARGRQGRSGEPEVSPVRTATAPGRILGIDPSLRGTGWGVVHLEGRQPRVVAHGTVRCPPAWDRSRCLAAIAAAMSGILGEYPVEVCAVESLFHARNVRTALIMGEARGAALAVVAGRGHPIFEIAPRRVKLAVAGHGAADKTAVARMVQRLTGIEDLPEPDAADALAIALAYAQEASRVAIRPLKRI